MRADIFRGVGTALVTPFTERGVDFPAFERLIDFQIENGVDALVVAGTTGEGSVLSGEEFRDLLTCAVEKTAGRVPVIAGAGSNDTSKAMEKTALACSLGADAVLLVTPYYNKTTQRGLIAHFRAIADVSEKPCILYNVPSRTGLNLLPETLCELAGHPRIAAVKEAGGNLSQVARIRRLCGENLAVYSGNDDQTVPILSLGGQGIISVASNVLPLQMSRLTDAWFAGETALAAEIQLALLDVMNQLMIETNPIPVKAACGYLGLCENRLRLPLVPMEEKNEARLVKLLEEARKI
ncbi:MAG: 4-hydroxy-tetrahydrodipicolinate synthase [Clostridia bacterium]|nr:4-hydroxy-tetrahydrodipicolinate synthase [Clostridia bacterium]